MDKTIKRIIAFCISAFLLLCGIGIYKNTYPIQKRIICISKSGGDRETEDCLGNIKHYRIKKLKYFKDAEIISISDDDIEKLKRKTNIEIYDDVALSQTEPKIIRINNLQNIPWGIKHVGANEIWTKATGKGIKVAILDSGISKHEDLCIKGEFNVIDPGKQTADDFGHGTLVAGIIAAKNNKIGVVGIAPNADIYSVKVLYENGFGYLSDLVEGINWCIENHMQIVNLSLAVKSDLPLLKDAVNKALDAGIMVVAAAGNSTDKDARYPAAYKGVVSVGSVDKKNNIDKFASTVKVDYCAPGVDILSTFKNGDYAIVSGTSMAAPHVTGILALMLSDKKNDFNSDGVISVNEVKKAMSKSYKDLGIKGYDKIYGFGLLKAR